MAMTVRDLQIKQSSRMVTNFLRRHTRIHWRKDWDPTEPTATRPLAFTDHTAAPPATYFYTHDLTKNICELLSRNGSAVEVVTEYDYTPFGAVIASNSATPNTFTFSSEVLDAEISLIYYNYRHYNPVDGRWISRDPISERGGKNLYKYATNNSITNIDFIGTGPGSITCAFKAIDSDSGWKSVGYMPGSDYVSGGSSGGGVSDTIILMYERTIVNTYSCCCYLPSNTTEKTRTLVYIYTVAEQRKGGFLWAGIPGTWPPLTITDAIISKLISDSLSGILSDGRERAWVNSKQKAATPAASVIGSVSKDSGVPTRWCFWK